MTSSDRPFIDGGHFDYSAHFSIQNSYDPAVLKRIEAYVVDRRLEDHRYFHYALERPEALAVWLSQELVMTNVFSQIVLFAASRIENVHVRAALCAVASGEHGSLRNGQARRAHPALLDQLRAAVGLPEGAITPYTPTVAFVRQLKTASLEPLSAVAAIGVGNERLIVPEYRSVWRCFEAHYPDAPFEPFLSANIEEDRRHAQLCDEAALQLISSEFDASAYEAAALKSVDARYQYFDGLCEIAKQM